MSREWLLRMRFPACRADAPSTTDRLGGSLTGRAGHRALDSVTSGAVTLRPCQPGRDKDPVYLRACRLEKEDAARAAASPSAEPAASQSPDDGQWETQRRRESENLAENGGI